MPETTASNSLQSLIGALIFSAHEPLSIADLHKSLTQTGQKAEPGTPEANFATVTKTEIKHLLKGLKASILHAEIGLTLDESDGHFSLRTLPGAGKWLAALQKVTTPQKLSRPAIETLAIIAYRQPISRAEIESVRGVAVDHIIRLLLELDLIRTIGRSELPGRPFLYATTSTFLEHFGLTNLNALNDIDPTIQRDDPAERRKQHIKQAKTTTLTDSDDPRQAILDFQAEP